MKIYVFGNPDLKMDSLPIRILPELRRKFPQIEFEIKDPNEEWENLPEELVIIDTTIGIEKITIFDSLEKFAPAPRVSMHDFDTLANLRYLKKLGKIKKVKIIGIPYDIKKSEAIKKISKIISEMG
jgi:Ni,Fe-hydrogenase maturation factor